MYGVQDWIAARLRGDAALMARFPGGVQTQEISREQGPRGTPAAFAIDPETGLHTGAFLQTIVVEDDGVYLAPGAPGGEIKGIAFYPFIHIHYQIGSQGRLDRDLAMTRLHVLLEGVNVRLSTGAGGKMRGLETLGPYASPVAEDFDVIRRRYELVSVELL